MNIDELLKNKDQNQTIVSHFKSLKDNAGWQLLEQIVDKNIKILEDQILNGFDEETKEQIDRKRDKLKAYKEVIETPNTWIKRLEQDPIIESSDDPYA